MIHGTVVGLQARMGVIIRPIGSSEVDIECVVDTGFEGFLTLPPSIVAELGLTYLGPLRANLADNSRIITNVHQATIVWNGSERNIPVLAMGRRPLIGTALLADYHLFYEGGTVLVDDIL
ncbi:MAG: clan AA aspartic protease [Cyanosarcina radialis HA8281-LM2]|jgi:clan AA aspartic protease|nr:clan AA aspartic protease [Cyanosarcina radialis HA8281-LM2]